MFMYAIAFMLGGCFISCGNCISYRRRRGLDWVHGHSFCEGCGKRLHMWELIPVLSCVFLRGRCPKCGHFFGFQHAESEAVGGMLALFLYMTSTSATPFFSVFLFGIIFCCVSWLQGKPSDK